MQEASSLFLGVEQCLLSFRAEHLEGVKNVAADWLRCQHVSETEWHVHPRVTRRRLGMPLVDLFTSQANAQLPRFFSQILSPGAEGTDALQSPWPPGLLYAFPSLQLIPLVLKKV